MEIKKYKLVETEERPGLFRVEALLNFGKIRKGEMGGLVESEKNLAHSGNAWVYGDAMVYGNARVSGNTRVDGDARVYGDAWVYGHARVSGDAMVYGKARVYGSARVYGGVWAKSPLQIQGSKHFVTTSGYNKISIGCENHSVEHWLKNYQKIGNDYGYTKEEIEEYLEYIKVAARFYDLKTKTKG